MNAQAEYLGKSDASVYSGISPRALDAAKARGEIPFYRFGSRKVLFARRDLDKWLATMRVELNTK